MFKKQSDKSLIKSRHRYYQRLFGPSIYDYDPKPSRVEANNLLEENDPDLQLYLASIRERGMLAELTNKLANELTNKKR